MYNQALNVGALANNTKPELKNFDTSAAAGPTANIWVGPDPLGSIPGGTTRTQRVGSVVTLKSLSIRCSWVNSGGDNCPRMVIVYDKASNGGTPLVTDIFARDSYNTHMNIGNSERFLVIADRLLQKDMGFGGTSGENLATHYFRKFPKPGLIQKYTNSNVGDVSTIRSGMIWILFCVPSSSTAITYDVRLRFYDA